MGLYNMIGRVSVVAAPMVAEMPEPWPMSTSMILCALAFFSVTILKKTKDGAS